MAVSIPRFLSPRGTQQDVLGQCRPWKLGPNATWTCPCMPRRDLDALSRASAVLISPDSCQGLISSGAEPGCRAGLHPDAAHLQPAPGVSVLGVSPRAVRAQECTAGTSPAPGMSGEGQKQRGCPKERGNSHLVGVPGAGEVWAHPSQLQRVPALPFPAGRTCSLPILYHSKREVKYQG